MQHGGDLTEAMERHGGTLADWLDLSSGINPHAYPLPQVPAPAWTRLPARADLDRLLAAARTAYAVPAGADIVAAPGTSAIIALLPRLVSEGPVAIFGPTYGDHAAAWQAVGHGVIDVPAGGTLPAQARHAVLVHPNNPDGRMLAREAALRIATAVAERGGVLVVDESFIDLVPQQSHVALCPRRPVLVLRSFGKFYGLAGLRLGFAIAAPRMAQGVAGALGSWAVSGPALAVGAEVLADQGWAEAMRAWLAAEAAALDRVLVKAGLTLVGGTGLFRFARHPNARALHEALAVQRIWVRRFDFADDMLRFGLPGSPAGLERLRAALAHG